MNPLPRLYRGEASSVAEQVLRDSLILLRERLIHDMASADITVPPTAYAHFVARARNIVELQDMVHNLVKEAMK